MKNFTTSKMLTSLLLGLIATQANSSKDWYVSTTLSGLAGSYSKSVERSNLSSGSIIINADYLDTYSYALSINTAKINFKDTGAGAFSIDQTAVAGQFQYHIFNDSLGGKITVSLVAHSISNNDSTSLSDNVTVIAPKVAFTSFANDQYLDFEFVDSSYPNNGNLSIQQISSSYGVSFNHSSDWLRVKGYFIQSSDKTLSQGEDSLMSIDTKWQHWLTPGAPLNINNFFVSALIGKRIYAVDNDSFSVYNLADVQQGSLSAGANWNPKKDFSLSTIIGIDRYENTVISNTYNQLYLYFSATKHW